MKLEAYGSHIEAINVGDHDTRCTITVSEEREIGGYGLSASARPYPAYIIEWEFRPDHARVGKEKWRNMVTLPEDHTVEWLDDLVRANAERNIFIVGIMPLADVALQPYTVPEAYRAKIAAE